MDFLASLHFCALGNLFIIFSTYLNTYCLEFYVDIPDHMHVAAACVNVVVEIAFHIGRFDLYLSYMQLRIERWNTFA